MIVSYILTGILIVLSVIIQGHTSFDVIRIAGVKPDLQFIIIVYLSYSFGSFYGEVTGFLGGLLHDAVSNSPLGLLAFPKMAVGFIAGMFGRNMIKSSILTITLLIFVYSIIKGIIILFLSYIFHQASVGSVISVILPEAFYNALLAPPIFVILDKLYEKSLEMEGLL